MRELGKRVLSALIGAPVILFTCWWGGYPFLGFVMSVGILGLMEFYDIVAYKGVKASRGAGIIATIILLTCAFFDNEQKVIVPTFLFLFLIVAQVLKREKGSPLISVGATLLGFFYVAWLISYVILLRNLEEGRFWTIVLLLVTWSTDTMAYIVGKTMGRRKLAPSISPNKTVEGFWGGVLGAVLFSSIMGWLFTLPPLWTLLFGFVMGVWGQLGDLGESLFKREVALKDISGLIPGHGGVLDRFDSFLFNAPMIYYFLFWTGVID
ncbi:MAG: phosphatidate cytidylyltransferase [Synergistetes bacterium]|nr:phosphatidate cytidylyltransferase [Synergistota bacterium]MCX8127938.1 phosphatidate cytidylyltransferase [Synergistota bacterium]MDW8192021.1 phosphatidate cytidylyltransferase [Synergistota bacterium]